jgi:hypothetical protein
MFKFSIHSVVDVITNSSTVIYTYQSGCVSPAKDLINEVLKLSGVDKKADDVFCFAVFCDNERYSEEYGDMPEDYPKAEGKWDSDEYKEGIKKQEEWLENLKTSIIKGEIEKPEWMEEHEKSDYDSWNPDSYLHILPKDDKYLPLVEKIQKLLGSISADGGRDG